MTHVIEVENLKKVYALPKAAQKNGVKEFEAVAGTTFQVIKGEIFGILGPNGAGKTTTLEILEGLKQPTSGTVNILGLDVTKDSTEVKRRIGVQLQSSAYLDQLSLAELLEFFGALYHKKADVDQLLGLVGLMEKKHELVKNLSGGQKQRFTLAAALVNDPEILFLDEPTTGLDPRVRREIWDLIQVVNKKGITVVITTHYMEEAEILCNRVAIMDSGRILALDNPHTLITALKHTTQVSFFLKSEDDVSYIAGLPKVTRVFSTYPKVVMEVENLDAVSGIIDGLTKHQANYSGFTVRTATLEEVYLDLTGKEFDR
jgi:ABC-2 type transport system ATP-binding protein